MSKDLVVFNEAERFDELVQVIADATTNAYLVTGEALLEIKDQKLYKARNYNTFEDAARDIFDYSKAYANQLIKASAVHKNLAAIAAVLPTNESQLRPLTKLLPEQQVEVWQEASKDGVPTAKVVKEAVQRKYPKAISTPTKTTPGPVKHTPKQLETIESLRTTCTGLRNRIATLENTINTQNIKLMEQDSELQKYFIVSGT